jgi:hypothetical protein
MTKIQDLRELNGTRRRRKPTPERQVPRRQADGSGRRDPSSTAMLAEVEAIDDEIARETKLDADVRAGRRLARGAAPARSRRRRARRAARPARREQGAQGVPAGGLTPSRRAAQGDVRPREPGHPRRDVDHDHHGRRLHHRARVPAQRRAGAEGFGGMRSAVDRLPDGHRHPAAVPDRRRRRGKSARSSARTRR